jgi:hypothetical protein
MSTAEYIGEFEQLVLPHCWLGRDARRDHPGGNRVARRPRDVDQRRLRRSSGSRARARPIRIGAPTPQRGRGKRKRHYELLAPGIRALRQSLATMRRMTDGLEGVLEPSS